MRQKEYEYWLANINGIGIKKIKRLLDVFGSEIEIFKASDREMLHKTDLNAKDIHNIITSKNIDNIKRQWEELNKKRINFISIHDNGYPDKLKQLYDSPYALYYKGSLPKEGEISIAIIGARDCSSYGIEMAKYFSRSISNQGISIISGMARGIDSIAHEETICSGNRTYGILGCGVDIVYPRENFNIYMKMQQNGGIISEYNYGVQPLAQHFPMRNRLISGLSDGILVIEARKRSGTLITVEMGLDQGKEIYIIPGKVTDKLSEGCNNLLKEGAKLVMTPEDILDDLIINYENKEKCLKKSINLLASKEKIVYACLCFMPKHIDEILAETKLQLSELLEALFELELKNLIYQSAKNYYIKQMN